MRTGTLRAALLASAVVLCAGFHGSPASPLALRAKHAITRAVALPQSTEPQLRGEALQRHAPPSGCMAGVAIAPNSRIAVAASALLSRVWFAGSSVCSLSSRLALPAWTRFCLIPVVAGLLNLATNQLAVNMMFYPLRYRGIGRLGWQGIVPSKAEKMANKIVDDVLLRLIDIREVFGRLDAEAIAVNLEPTILRVGNSLAADLAARNPLAAAATPAIGSAIFNQTVARYAKDLVRDIVGEVQAAAPQVFDLRNLVVSGIMRDRALLVRLFETCGAPDLRFVVWSGLWLGGVLGVLQMLLWMVWSPWWSLALTGGLVGMFTDQLALKAIFEPVKPVRLGRVEVQGLFLKRQDEVSGLFSDFMAAEVVAPQCLWTELLHGANSVAFWSLVSGRLEAYMGQGARVLQPLLGTKDWRWLQDEVISRVRSELPLAAPLLYDLTREDLELRTLMTSKMRLLTSAEFERVLHPVFEEDEWILISIGTLLGAIAGAAQARWGMM